MKGMSGSKNTGKNAGDHKGGRGDHQYYTKPGYPSKTEGVTKTVASPNYPRSNFAGGKRHRASSNGGCRKCGGPLFRGRCHVDHRGM